MIKPGQIYQVNKKPSIYGLMEGTRAIILYCDHIFSGVEYWSVGNFWFGHGGARIFVLSENEIINSMKLIGSALGEL